MPRDTQMFASTRRASRRSYHRASRTAGFHLPEALSQHRETEVVPVDHEPDVLPCSENHDTASVGNGGRVLRQHQVRAAAAAAAHATSAQADAQRVENGAARVGDACGLLVTQGRRPEAMNGDGGMLGNLPSAARCLRTRRGRRRRRWRRAPRAWYCMRALLPRSASARTTARMD